MLSSLKVKKKKNPIRNIGRCDSACLTAAKSLRWREPLYFSAAEQKSSWWHNQTQQTSCWNRLCGCGRASSFTTHKLFFWCTGCSCCACLTMQMVWNDLRNLLFYLSNYILSDNKCKAGMGGGGNDLDHSRFSDFQPSSWCMVLFKNIK